MKVSEELINIWTDLKEKGDNEKLAKLLKITTQNTSKIVCTGEGSTKQIAIVKRYFEKKQEQIKKLANA